MDTLFRVREVSDLFVDGCIRDPADGSLLFLSTCGRDGAMLHLFAAFALSRESGGLDGFTLVDVNGGEHRVPVPKPERLVKVTGKLPANLFGSLAQAWLFDQALTNADRANRSAWCMFLTWDGFAENAPLPSDIRAQVWQQLKELSPVPLLDAWQDEVMTMAEAEITWLDREDERSRPLGAITACRIALREDFAQRIADAVREGRLEVEHEAAAVSDSTPALKAAKVLGLGGMGRIVVTAGVHDTVNRARVGECLAMHSRGDWGCIGDDDKRSNDRALANGDERMLSAYPIDPARSCDDGGDNRLWVITEWDRSVTTVLLPSEY